MSAPTRIARLIDSMSRMATIADFNALDIRVGEIVEVHDFPEAKKPAFKLTIDFGSEIGVKRSSGRFTKHYSKDELTGKRILGVVNLPPRHIGPFVSEVLTLGVPDEAGEAVLVEVPAEAVLGGKLF